MKQVNVAVSDEEHVLLVKEAGKRMAESGKIVPIAAILYEMLEPAIANLNGKPTNNPTNDANPIETPQTNSKDGEQLNNAFANLDI